VNLTANIARRFGLVTRDELAHVREQALRRGFFYGSRSYAAAQLNRLTADWLTVANAIDADIKAGMIAVRSRARDLVKNNPYAKRFVNMYRMNVIGPAGIMFQANVREPSPDAADKGKLVPDEAANAKIQEAWEEWTKRENCSIDGRWSWRGTCHILAQYQGRDGEAALRLVTNKRSEFGFQVQIIPPDMIDEEYTARLDNGNFVIMGVEIDPWRRPVAYHLKPVEPSSLLYSNYQFIVPRERVLASDLLFGFDPEFIDQTRAVSPMAGSMKRLHSLGAGEEAIIMAYRIAAAKGGFFTSEEGEGGPWPGDDQDTEGNIVMEVEPGRFEQLPAGLKFQPWDPKFPSPEHEMFLKACLRGVASGWDVNYNSLANDYESVNLSSLRQARSEEQDSWRSHQRLFIETFCEPVFSRWLEMALLNRKIALPYERFDKYNKPNFVARTWMSVNPLEDAQAKILRRQAFFTSLFDIAGEEGKSFEQILADIAEEISLASKHGLDLSSIYDIKVSGPGPIKPQEPSNPAKPTNGKAKKQPVED
jgi:lambda family phage portal protein